MKFKNYNVTMCLLTGFTSPSLYIIQFRKPFDTKNMLFLQKRQFSVPLAAMSRN